MQNVEALGGVHCHLHQSPALEEAVKTYKTATGVLMQNLRLIVHPSDHPPGLIVVYRHTDRLQPQHPLRQHQMVHVSLSELPVRLHVR